VTTHRARHDAVHFFSRGAAVDAAHAVWSVSVSRLHQIKASLDAVDSMPVLSL